MEELLLQDVQEAVNRVFNALDTETGTGREQTVRGLSWVLSPATIVHARTGDAALLTQIRDGLIAFVDSSIGTEGQVAPLLGSFRELPPFCEAYAYLKRLDHITGHRLLRR